MAFDITSFSFLTWAYLLSVFPFYVANRSLNKLPVQVRYGLTGFLTNALFMIFYNSAVAYFKHTYSLSTIYCVVYILFIPVSHAAISLLCFGWPELYLISLLSNYPIGLTAMAMGAALTSYLDRADFNGKIEELTHRIFPFLDGSGRLLEARKDKSEFYSSFLVLIVTGVWTYVLSVYVNTPPATSEKKEL